MPWKEATIMSQRQEFIMLAKSNVTSFTDLCKKFCISRKTGYKWLARHEETGNCGLLNQSKRPLNSPFKTAKSMEKIILRERSKHPAWGARKLRQRLLVLGHKEVPAISTITEILHRHGCISSEKSKQHQAWLRFEHPFPNDLWQMDFKGHFSLLEGRCHPLTILDDHSRFSIGLQACPNETEFTVKNKLIEIFRRYGLPKRFTMDNGSPWGGSGEWKQWTALAVWLIRLGIGVSYSRPYHPQTQGKDERFHRTLKDELLNRVSLKNLGDAQKHFDTWRYEYNTERPHEALGMLTPVQRYQPSQRAYPESLAPIEYFPEDIVRKVQGDGIIAYRGKKFRVGRAFAGHLVAIRPEDELINVFFCQQKVKQYDLRLAE